MEQKHVLGCSDCGWLVTGLCRLHRFYACSKVGNQYLKIKCKDFKLPKDIDFDDVIKMEELDRHYGYEPIPGGVNWDHV